MLKYQLSFFFVVGLLFAANEGAVGQTRQRIKPRKAKIMTIARPYRDSILLRWAPDDQSAWQFLNKEGYVVKRQTLTRDGKLVSSSVFKVLTAKPIVPAPKASWQALVEADDKYGTIAAQALYGDDFEVTQEVKGNPAQVINMVKQNEQRFSMALFSADQSFRIAKAMGLAFTDTTAKSNESYRYVIIPNPKRRIRDIDSGMVDASFLAAKPLPKVTDLKAFAMENGVLVSWLSKPLLGQYTYYEVERSEDEGQTFVKINSIPTVNTQANDDIPNAERAFDMDSVSALGRVLVYRVKGISPFGEVGPSSDTIHVTAYHQLKEQPIIKEAKVHNGTVQIDWTLPKTEAEVTGFDIERSSSKEKGFLKINSQLIPLLDSSFIDLKPNNINFYRVKAYARNSPSLSSLDVLVQMPDSIPPAPPKGMSGEINKKGIVKLKWEANAEPDLFGYRVFRANSEDGEYAQVTKTTRLLNSFIDTVDLKTLTKYVFYKFVAIDKRYNPSGFSEVLKLKRPDIVPPASAVITAIKALPNGIYLSWYRSVSEDVVKHELLRTPVGKEDWKTVISFTDTTKSYVDQSAELNQPYSYKIRAVDDSYLSSESKAFTSKRLDLGLQPDVTIFRGTADRENQQIILKWDYKRLGVSKYLLYKAEVSKPLRLYKAVDANLNTFKDDQLFINTSYEYRIKAVFADGTESRFSDRIVVEY
ncbi:MAG: hypothetical protein H7Y13_16245 [Sphingobacteriaceae bacterium]|nr:hypothetical protein [Sphingobacteriaceae bacterium]